MNGRKSLRCFSVLSKPAEVVSGNCLCDRRNATQLLCFLHSFFLSFLPLSPSPLFCHLALLFPLSLPLSIFPSQAHTHALARTHTLTHIHKHVLHKPSLCSQMSWEREASVPFHLKHTRTHTETHTCIVSVGRGVSLCRNAGMIGCRGVRGETHAVTARHLKTLHPESPTTAPSFLHLFLCKTLFHFRRLCLFLFHLTTMLPHLATSYFPPFLIYFSLSYGISFI